MTIESDLLRTKFLLGLTLAIGIAILVALGYFGSRLNSVEDRLTTLSERASDTQVSQAYHTVYVPAYSHVYSDGGLPILLEVALHVRNTDPKVGFTLTRADYYDTKGKLLRRYIASPHQLAPLESTEFIVEKTDHEGGSGANFIVQWSADSPVSPPLVEAVMVGMEPEYSFSFVRSGVTVTGFTD